VTGEVLTGGGAHGGELLVVTEDLGDLGDETVGGELRIVDEAGGPGLHDAGRVESLLTITVRQRHVQGGQSRGGDLGDGHRAGAADDEIGDGVGGRHVVDVGQRHVVVVLLGGGVAL